MTKKQTLKSVALMLLFVLCVGTRLQAQFITTWVTTNGTITIPTLASSGTYNYAVTWTNLTNAGVGNGTLTAQTGNANITGLQNGSTYSVSISGAFPHFFMGYSFPVNPQAQKLRTIVQWGTNAWTSMREAFAGCINLTYPAMTTDNPNLAGVTNMSQMFADCSLFNGNIGSWNTSTITNMNAVFYSCSVFNQNINTWNTANVTNMSGMFTGCSLFNQSLNTWNTANVTDMSYLFYNCSVFNGNITSWNVARVTNMEGMFTNATPFNQNIGGWNIVSVTNLGNTFQNTVFNQNIGGWNTANVRDMSSTFALTSAFNQDIGNWNTTNVTDVNGMATMFNNAIAFNQDISRWNTANVIEMFGMFDGARAFNQNISGWNTTNVGTGTPFANGNMERMFNGATSFNQNLGNWNISNVLSLSGMLNNSGLSVANYDATLTGWATQTRSGLTLGATNLKYCTSVAARTTLTSAPRNWVITGDALFCCPTITISPATLAGGAVGIAYSQTLTQTGLTGTPVWSVSVGTLPTGLALASATGIISGTPTALQTSNFTILASSGICSQTKTYSVIVAQNPTTSINNVLSNEVKVSPNPSLGVFNVDFGALNVSKSVARVYNVQGATVHTSKVSNNMSISLENLPAGLYFLEVSTEKGSILKKLVKE